MLYLIVSAASYFIRNFYLPNPFESLRGQEINIGGIDFPLVPELLNWMIEGTLYLVTFKIVGLYYSRRERNPVKGSLLYLFFYIYHVALIEIMARCNFSSLSIATAIILFIGIHFVIAIIINVSYGIKTRFTY